MYLPLEKDGALLLNRLKSPSSKDALCQVWLKLAPLFWRRGFFNLVNVFSLFRNYLPLEKGGVLHLNLNPPRALCLNKLESSSPQDAFCQVWLKLAQWYCRRRFLNFVNVFSLFSNYFPFKQDLSPMDALWQVWYKLGKWLQR